MSDLITALELDGLRDDFAELLGIDDEVYYDTTGTITRVVESGQTIDPVTLKYTSGSSPVVVYSGAMFVGPVVFRRDRTETAGGEAQRIRQYRGLLPWDSGDIHIDDLLRIDTSSDPYFVGKVLIVSDVFYETHVAGRRITLTDDSRDSDACLTYAFHYSDAVVV